MKIAYLGGGSRYWARGLMLDLALCGDLAGQMSLYDIDRPAAELNARFGNWLQRQSGSLSRWSYSVAGTLQECMLDADFVVLSIQPAPLEVMGAEITAAEKYGLFFPVGDTIGAPGLVRGLRSTLIYEGFAHAIAEICPRAWVINYTNPMSICTLALTAVEPRLKVFGCCHEVFGTQRILAEVAAQMLQIPQPQRVEIHVNVTGVNHFTFVDRADYQGRDLLELLRALLSRAGVMRPFTRQEVETRQDYFQDNRQVKFALFQRLGVLPAAGDRHLVEFLPGFTRSEEELFCWGVIRTPVSWRIWRRERAFELTQAVIDGKAPLVLEPTGEEGVAQMRALLGLQDLVTNVNLENQGQIPDLPLGAVVETNAIFIRDSLRPVSAGPLPDGIASLVCTHVRNQEMIVQAALRRDKDLAFQAVYADPAQHLSLDQAWSMYGEMLLANHAYLPGWDTSSA